MRLSRSTPASEPSVNFGLVRRTSSKRARASLLKQAVAIQGGSVYSAKVDWEKTTLPMAPFYPSTSRTGTTICAPKQGPESRPTLDLFCSICSLQKSLGSGIRCFASHRCQRLLPGWRPSNCHRARSSRKFSAELRRRSGKLRPANLQLRHHLFDGEPHKSTVLVDRHR